MMRTERDKWGKTHKDIFDELLRERGITKYALIHGVGEGGILPTGLENDYWVILTPDEKIEGYWLDWDPEKLNPDGEKGYYIFRESVPSRKPNEQGQKDPYYLRARKELGLPLTEEQKQILQKWEEEHKVR